jgi:hypothetical protein
MKWFRRIDQGLSPHGGWVLRIGEIKLRRSDIFIDDPHPNRRQFRRSGILGRVASPGNFEPSVRYGLSDVAPTELSLNFAPTELFLIRRSFLHTLQKDFSDFHKHESRTC